MLSNCKTTCSQRVWKCSLRNDETDLIWKWTLRGQVGTSTEVLHNTQDNKTAVLRQSISVKGSWHLLQPGCVTVDKNLFRLLLVTFFHSEPEAFLRFYLYCKLRGACTLLLGGGPPQARHYPGERPGRRAEPRPAREGGDAYAPSSLAP